jgi:hypothetical protein
MQQMFVFHPPSHRSVHKFNYIRPVYFLSLILIYHRSSTLFSTLLLSRQFLPFPSPFLYLKFPSNLFFACLIQSSKIHYHFLSINLLYLFSNFALPYFPTSKHYPCHSTCLPYSFSLHLYASPPYIFAPCRSNICTGTMAQLVNCRPITKQAWVQFQFIPCETCA